MRVLIQRVTECSVWIEGKIHSSIGNGMLILASFEASDTDQDIEWICGKIKGVRIFDDCDGVMNLDQQQAGAEIITISQFTLHASTKKGNRPSYIRSAPSAISGPLYDAFNLRLAAMTGKKIETGVFGANMHVSLVNDGPVTIFIDSKNRE